MKAPHPQLERCEYCGNGKPKGEPHIAKWRFVPYAACDGSGQWQGLSCLFGLVPNGIVTEFEVGPTHRYAETASPEDIASGRAKPWYGKWYIEL
jgi:hypothetical protein